MKLILWAGLVIVNILGGGIFPKHPIVNAQVVFPSHTNLTDTLAKLSFFHRERGFTRNDSYDQIYWQYKRPEDDIGVFVFYTVKGNALHIRIVSHNFDSGQIKGISEGIRNIISSKVSEEFYRFEYLEQSSPFS